MYHLRVRGLWGTCSALIVACSYDPPALGPSDGPQPDTPGDQMMDTPVDAQRVTAGLIGLWTFDEGTGVLIGDSSGLMPVNTTIADEGQVTWGAGTLTVNGTVAIDSGFGTSNRLIGACQTSNAVSLEAWVTPSNVMQTGTLPNQPARIVTFAPANAGNHEIGIGQLAGQWAGSVRTNHPSVDVHGRPHLQHAIVGATAHLVVTADATGRRFYANGQRVDDQFGGALDLWDANHPLVFAGDPGARNPWVGTIHLVAIYDRSLSDAEVMSNFVIGP